MFDSFFIKYHLIIKKTATILTQTAWPEKSFKRHRRNCPGVQADFKRYTVNTDSGEQRNLAAETPDIYIDLKRRHIEWLSATVISFLSLIGQPRAIGKVVWGRVEYHGIALSLERHVLYVMSLSVYHGYGLYRAVARRQRTRIESYLE